MSANFPAIDMQCFFLWVTSVGGNDERYIVGRRKMPLSIPVHQKGEVLIMIICVVDKYIESCSTKQFIDFRLGNREFTGSTEKILVAIGVKVYRRKSLREDFLAVPTVEALSGNDAPLRLDDWASY